MKNVGQFLTEVKLELSKIIWPKFDELVGSIIVVFIVVTAFAIFLGMVNLVFYKIAQQLF